ncbi:MAG TPA: SGNH/GDSL hydrolase family protein [Nitrospiraceae bacterium]|nr:SGNH/GDSL hydrolase family protein [Nitrospiraceae bacterium]
MAKESVRFGAEARRMWMTAIVTNLVTILLTAAVLEGIFRITARESDAGLRILNLVVPYGESELLDRSRHTIDRISRAGRDRDSYFVYDSDLGWTVGRSRVTTDGMYASSEEGLRSASPGERLRDAAPRARVAIIGDSNAFSLEVPYQESLAHYLQKLLGADIQVLNFGVDGYGIDQIYLRYQRDVRPWHPDVVIVVFVEHDLWRTMIVYPFLSLGWPGYLVKPRFDNGLTKSQLINVPLITHEKIMSIKYARELPYLAYDPWSKRDWWTSWIERGPLVLRVIAALSPRWSPPDPQFSEDAIVTLNARLFVKMRNLMVQEGVTPILLLVPRGNRTPELSLKTLRLAQVPFLDVSGCVTEVPDPHRYVPSGNHFTGHVNAALAKCVSSEVQKVFSPPHHP